jgi:hypothetical protein
MEEAMELVTQLAVARSCDEVALEPACEAARAIAGDAIALSLERVRFVKESNALMEAPPGGGCS